MSLTPSIRSFCLLSSPALPAGVLGCVNRRLGVTVAALNSGLQRPYVADSVLERRKTSCKRDKAGQWFPSAKNRVRPGPAACSDTRATTEWRQVEDRVRTESLGGSRLRPSYFGALPTAKAPNAPPWPAPGPRLPPDSLSPREAPGPRVVSPTDALVAIRGALPTTILLLRRTYTARPHCVAHTLHTHARSSPSPRAQEAREVKRQRRHVGT
jgi:hypothetical protein